ncbi:MAG: acetyl-CoA carboxylase biotin carboxyl carrier protein [Acidobacteria bacterium]|nr:acetyl-CoA carboxylase biotin carboxyl carrier protein [Acidobacteriota bacterium]MBI3657990.1 acetyl-CoA carboxylase biotin carboxyl carrier protein [Acidobacteriota bacterium]
MDLSELKELLRTVVENDISEFEYEEAGVRIRIKRDHPAGASGEDSRPITESPFNAGHSLGGDERQSIAKAAAQGTAAGIHTIVSPIVGTFYNGPSPGVDPFVHVGDMVQEGTVLCIVEAMKLMNEVKSDVSGKVIDILVENSQPVEYGQKLYLIQLRKG